MPANIASSITERQDYVNILDKIKLVFACGKNLKKFEEIIHAESDVDKKWEIYSKKFSTKLNSVDGVAKKAKSAGLKEWWKGYHALLKKCGERSYVEDMVKNYDTPYKARLEGSYYTVLIDGKTNKGDKMMQASLRDAQDNFDEWVSRAGIAIFDSRKL